MKTFIIILLLLSSFVVKPQTVEEFEYFKKLAYAKKSPYYLEYAKNSKGIPAKIATGFFLLYKSFISSQDVVSCSFEPSCSEYAILAMKKQNIVTGILNSFDRLTRCHPFTPDSYTINSETHLQIDPVRNAHYEAL